MKKLSLLFLIMTVCLLLASCGKEADEPQPDPDCPLEDGVYSAEFRTDSTMFHINEAYDNRGVLTVRDGKMTIHVTLVSQKVVNLFYGKAAQAKEPGAALLMPTIDTVTYDDGDTDEVYGFDIPVPYLDDEFDVAMIGTHGNWYDHRVRVTDPVPYVENGEYTVEVTLTGGSGKASVSSPAAVFSKNGKLTAEIVWSSPNYEYMTLNDVQYDRVNTEGNSTFIIPITLDEDIAVSALTTAMSEPHLIDYTLHFDSATLQRK
jgi:hypothetical protein